MLFGTARVWKRLGLIGVLLWAKLEVLMGVFFDFILVLFRYLKVEDLVLFCVTIWRIWYCRNAKLHGTPNCDLSEVGTWCKQYLQEYQTSQMDNSSVSCGLDQLVVSWIPPIPDQYKTNCCSVFDRGKGRIGFGIIIRNSKGEIMASSAQFIEARFSIKISQLLAIKRSILFGMDCGLAPNTVEINESVVVNWLSSGSHKDSEYGVILDEIDDLMHSGDRIVFCSIPKRANMPAIALAKEALKISEEAFWMEECPPFINDIVKADKPV
ncbi:hypothetical protein Dsin_015500 [Dipteronia sinensis]|uniref:RNase H type-1 domain-containing protein n=1 Tax=Dipteronia sinensis TaxID=43782 RepID=A0AAE0ABN2_9ROSI|nr:hypothetical protein Dsin_015500 [Dipteronia sinensis]